MRRYAWMRIFHFYLSTTQDFAEPRFTITNIIPRHVTLRCLQQSGVGQCLINAVVSTGRCNTTWFKCAFKDGVYGRREAVWAFCDAEERHVAPLEGGTVAA
jgi:hypothetical protein